MYAGDRCYDFYNIFAAKFSENIGVFCPGLLQVFAKKLIMTLFFGKKSQKMVIITSTPGA
jgi:hypothetical protein